MSLVSYTRAHAMQMWDSLQNFVSGLGTLKDPRSHTHFVFRELSRHQIENAYRSDWLARRIVDLPAEDATREWRAWQADPKKIKAIEDLERGHAIQRKTRQALQRARLYGGAALVLGVDQGEPEDELDLDAVKKGDLKFVAVLHRWELNGGPRIYNIASPWYTRPEYYQVAAPVFGFFGEEGGSYPGSQIPVQGVTGRDPMGRYGASPPPADYGKPRSLPVSEPRNTMASAGGGNPVYIHPSRVIEFVGNEMPDWRMQTMGAWGDSVLQTVDDTLRDFAMIVSGLASLVNDMKMDVVKVPQLTAKMATKELTQKTLERFSLSNQAKSSINTLLLDKEEDWERIQTSFGSTPELIKVCMTLACGAGGIPESRILGNAPDKGLAASGSSGGEVDIKNYYDDISSQQRTKYKPMLRPLDICVQASALGSYDEDIDYVWNPLYQPDPKDEAAVRLTKAQTTQVYMSLGLFNEDLMREATASQISQDDVYPGWDDAVDANGLEPEEPEPTQMPLPPNPPPGMMPKGQFDPNPYHMLRAQQAAKSGQPIRVPPNRPAGPPKFFPAPKGAQPALPGTKDAEIDDFSPDQPRDQQGQWVSGVAYHADTKQWHGADGDPLPRHVQDMKIPPAWANVRVNLDPDGDLLATGRDAKNRRTAIYSDAHWAKAAEAKYSRVKEMADKFDKIMGENAGRQASDDANERDHADAFELVAKTGIRPGSDKDTGAETQAYGATTLEGRHIRQGGKRLAFTGKKGVDLDLPVDDEGLAARLGARAKAAGKTGRLFPNVTADSLSAYTHTLDGGGFKVKDLRTRLANATAMDSMKGVAPPSSPTGYRKAVATIAKKVAAKLGNSPTVALASYINPAVFSHWRMHAQAA